MGAERVIREGGWGEKGTQRRKLCPSHANTHKRGERERERRGGHPGGVGPEAGTKRRAITWRGSTLPFNCSQLVQTDNEISVMLGTSKSRGAYLALCALCGPPALTFPVLMPDLRFL